VSLNSEVNFNPFFNLDYILNMLEWLDNDLQKSAKWKVVYMHRPLYCSKNNAACNEDAKGLRKMFESIFFKHKVDLVLTGHRHNYERLIILI
jgi:hypothetical protein